MPQVEIHAYKLSEKEGNVNLGAIVLEDDGNPADTFVSRAWARWHEDDPDSFHIIGPPHLKGWYVWNGHQFAKEAAHG